VDEDFNRVWSPEALDGPRDSVELRRARALRPFVDRVDLLLDIHSMQHRTPPLMMAGPLAKGRELARRVGIPELVVSDQGHAAGRRLRDYGGFGDPESPRNALLVECGQHWEAAAAPLAVETALRFLLACGTLDADDVAGRLGEPPPAQRFIEVTQAVTIESDDFAFVEDFRGMETIPLKGSLLARDGGKPVVTPYDNCVLIMPSRRLLRGQTAVRLGRYLD
jgi:predicted deacylase